MPAPLGKTPTKKMPNIQVLGTDDSAATRGALRFFRERRIIVRYVDLRKRSIALEELRRFTERLGAGMLAENRVGGGVEPDPERPAADAAHVLARLRADPRLIRLPLVRYGDDVTAGSDEATWKAWLARRR